MCSFWMQTLNFLLQKTKPLLHFHYWIMKIKFLYCIRNFPMALLLIRFFISWDMKPIQLQRGGDRLQLVLGFDFPVFTNIGKFELWAFMLGGWFTLGRCCPPLSWPKRAFWVDVVGCWPFLLVLSLRSWARFNSPVLGLTLTPVKDPSTGLRSYAL